MNCLGYEQLSATQLASAIGLQSIPAGCECVWLQAETANVRWRMDGTNPATAVGMLLVASAVPTVIVGKLADLKFVAASGSPLLNVTYWGSN